LSAFDNHLTRASQGLASSQAATTLLLGSYHPAPRLLASILKRLVRVRLKAACSMGALWVKAWEANFSNTMWIIEREKADVLWLRVHG